ncbi:MAG TPA: DUF192 domain-containing protein [Candidatus Pacearchaeota archaeon]|nr:DUF192 domain-containing protein [Candidatus Pacearchaeota archaeon]HOK93991.1 DUF192 domain-containing protein [Candidatus Pacearchaeota archaeon]HPO75062.1 DUF192 domain-containing protein [Candidatus Pacearchaeota archaeon]
MKFKKKIFLIIIGVLVVIFFIWRFSVQENNIKKIIFYQNDKKITEISVEVADNPLKREEGLMHRETLPENQGMLFVFPKEDYYSFWMKGALIPLDLIFLNKNKNIVSIIKNTPPCKANPCPLYQPKEKSQYVIEVNAGFCDQYKINKEIKILFSFN